MTTDTSITVDEIAAEVTRRRAAKSNANWSLSAADARAWYAAGWRDLSGAYLRRADLTEANLFGADLFGADLSGANLRGADLTEANLFGADLTGANLTGANLSGADLSRADLRGANLTEANLFGADLSGADLFGADLSEANLFGADLSGANLRGADLSGAKGILTCGPAPHSGRIISAYYHAGDTHIQAGCFNGTLAAFKQRVEHPDTAGEYPTTPEGQAWYRSLFPILDYFASLNPTNIERNPQ
jgi:hypothetical protein